VFWRTLKQLDIVKYSFLSVVFNAVNRKKKADSTSEKQCTLNYKIQPFSRQLYDPIYSVQLLAAKDSHVFFSQNLYEDLRTYLPFILHSILHKLSSFAVRWQQFHKLLQPLGELTFLHSRYQEICLISVSLTKVNL